jgi:hypothetical protein
LEIDEVKQEIVLAQPQYTSNGIEELRTEKKYTIHEVTTTAENKLNATVKPKA